MADQPVPFVSVIVPVYNDERRIGRCIEALLAQRWPKDRLEIIIVDNNSRDKTREIIARYPVTMLVERDRQSSYAARNLGLAQARGEILAFTDSDAYAHPRWIANAVVRMQRDSIDYLSCRVRLFFENGRKPTLLDMVDYLYAFENKADLEINHTAPTVSMVTRRSVVEAVGAFNPELKSGGDSEFGRRVWKAGYKQAYEASALVYHPCRSDLRSFLERTWRYGRARLILSRRFPDLFGPAHEQILRWRELIPPHPVRFRQRLRRRFRFGLPAVAAIFCLFYLNRWVYQTAKTVAYLSGAR